MPTLHKYQRNKKHYAQWQREYRLRKPAFSHKLRTTYTRDECQRLYEHFFRLQGGCCAICGKEGNGKRRLHLDHSHKTERVRGLLCWSCNTKLGWTEKWMGSIVKYLRASK